MSDFHNGGWRKIETYRLAERREEEKRINGGWVGYERIGKIGSRQMSKQVKFDIFLSQSFISRYLDGWGVDTSYYRLCCSRIYIVRDVNNIMLASSLSAFLSFSALFGFFRLSRMYVILYRWSICASQATRPLVSPLRTWLARAPRRTTSPHDSCKSGHINIFHSYVL